MSRFSVNISNIVITNEEYQKLRVYAGERQISTQEAIRLLIDSLPECSKTNKKLFHRRFLHVSLDDR